ncbi:PREDICTED: uncharacterized protein LOC108564430 [Nicrophorus vespilloides]|uniref:Uncharacterized protein LOC108564430 n=1 Tax=Nicrophorus vespilloides TaxID=110193 RepID=A0ABM1MWL6_NICVS|nr:PREDICTED: uncharacterized protein LOC108564430 [Nicrophorus vespilloides]
MKTLLAFILVLAIIDNVFSIYVTNTNVTQPKKKNRDDPAVWTEDEVWGPILEDYALTSHREKRVLRYSTPYPAQYITIERADKYVDEGKEGKVSPGKIVTRPSNVPQKKQPGKQVSETDLYLLGAIEKLVYRVDFMEKRLRRVEEMLYYVMAGNRIDQEPCAANFTRAGSNCYYFASYAGREMDWKAANKHCHKLGAVLVEMETMQEKQDIVAYIQSNSYLQGKDFWTGGLNPGLLWIWSGSAKAVITNKKDENLKPNELPSVNIHGEGRCLRLAYDPALRSYVYKGTDCSVRFNYICELPESTSTNEIKRIGRERKLFIEDEL